VATKEGVSKKRSGLSKTDPRLRRLPGLNVGREKRIPGREGVLVVSGNGGGLREYVVESLSMIIWD